MAAARIIVVSNANMANHINLSRFLFSVELFIWINYTSHLSKSQQFAIIIIETLKSKRDYGLRRQKEKSISRKMPV